MAVGPASGSLMPLVAGRLFDAYGIGAIFVMIAAMYVIFALCIQLMPETFGRSLEDLNQPAGADDAVGELAVA